MRRVLAPFSLYYDGPTGQVRADQQILQSLLLVRSLYSKKLDADRFFRRDVQLLEDA